MAKIKRISIFVLIVTIVLILAYKIYNTEPERRAFILRKYTDITGKNKVEVELNENLHYVDAMTRKRIELVGDKLLEQTEYIKDYYKDYTQDIITKNIRASGVLKSQIFESEKSENDKVDFLKSVMVYNEIPIIDIFTLKKYNMIDISIVNLSTDVYKVKSESNIYEYFHSGVIYQGENIRIFYSLSDKKITKTERRSIFEDDYGYLFLEGLEITFKGLNEEQDINVEENYGSMLLGPQRDTEYKDIKTSREFRISAREEEKHYSRNSYYVVILDNDSFKDFEDVDVDFKFTIKN